MAHLLNFGISVNIKDKFRRCLYDELTVEAHYTVNNGQKFTILRMFGHAGTTFPLNIMIYLAVNMA